MRILIDVAAILFNSAVFTYVAKTIYNEWKHRRHNRNAVKKGVTDTARLYSLMSGLLQTGEIKRVIILKAHNGGKTFSAFSLQYVTALHGVATDPFSIDFILSRVKNWRIDADYSQFLDHLEKEKKVVFVTEEMPKNSKLRTLYETEGVQYTEAYSIGTSACDLYYFSLSTNNSLSSFSRPGTREAIDHFNDAIQEIFKTAILKN